MTLNSVAESQHAHQRDEPGKDSMHGRWNPPALRSNQAKRGEDHRDVDGREHVPEAQLSRREPEVEEDVQKDDRDEEFREPSRVLATVWDVRP